MNLKSIATLLTSKTDRIFWPLFNRKLKSNIGFTFTQSLKATPEDNTIRKDTKIKKQKNWSTTNSRMSNMKWIWKEAIITKKETTISCGETMTSTSKVRKPIARKCWKFCKTKESSKILTASRLLLSKKLWTKGLSLLISLIKNMAGNQKLWRKSCSKF